MVVEHDRRHLRYNAIDEPLWHKVPLRVSTWLVDTEKMLQYARARCQKPSASSSAMAYLRQTKHLVRITALRRMILKTTTYFSQQRFNILRLWSFGVSRRAIMVTLGLHSDNRHEMGIIDDDLLQGTLRADRPQITLTPTPQDGSMTDALLSECGPPANKCSCATVPRPSTGLAAHQVNLSFAAQTWNPSSCDGLVSRILDALIENAQNVCAKPGEHQCSQMVEYSISPTRPWRLRHRRKTLWTLG